MTTCPKDDVLIALRDGELAESQAHAVRAHADGCTRCRAELAELATITDDLRAPVPGALGGKSAEDFADDVLASIDRPRRRESRAPRSRWWIAAIAAALPLAVIGVLRTTAKDEWTARGAATTTTTPNTTSRTLIRFGRVAGSSFEPILEGAMLDQDALLAAEVGNTVAGAPSFLLAFLIDARGERHWIYPVYEPGAPPPSSIALPVAMATPKVLGSMVRLDRPAPGPARLVAIVLSHSESVEHIEHAPLDQLAREQLAARYEGSLVVVTHVEIRSK